MTKFAPNNITYATHKYLCLVSQLNQNKFVELLRNTCNNTLQNASALYTPIDAVQGGTHIKNPKPSKECTYGVRKSGRNHIYRNL